MQAAPTLVDRVVTVDGEEHRYAVLVPASYRRGVPMPAILFLHGRGECGTDGRRQTSVGLGPAATAAPGDWPFIIVMPQKPDPDREWECFEALAMDSLAAVRREFTIDPARVYLTGLSQGGHGTWVLGGRHADLFAAIAPVCGYGRPKSKSIPGAPADAASAGGAVAGLPVWAFHGLRDNVVSPQETRDVVAAAVAARRARSLPEAGDPILTLYPDADHNSWDHAYGAEGLGRWFLKHERPR